VDYDILWEDNLPYSVCLDFIGSDIELVSAFQICETIPMKDGVDLYNHYLGCCDKLGVLDVNISLDRMLAFDYLISNSDRHFGNFGAVRNAETLEWIGPASLFDNGTSLWCGTVNAFINPETDTENATFRKKHMEQLELVSSFDWFKPSMLNGIVDEFDVLLENSPYMDEERRNFLCCALQKRIELLSGCSK